MNKLFKYSVVKLISDEFSSLPIMVAATLQIVTYDIRFPVIEHFNKILHDDREGNGKFFNVTFIEYYTI